MKQQITKNENHLWDWFILLGLAIVCFFLFLQEDILHTAGSSIAYLNGHFADFYEYNKELFKFNNYLPSSYIVFAIWGIPLKIFGLIPDATQLTVVARLWYKLLPCLCFALSGFQMYKIGMSLGFDTKKSKTTAFIFLSSMIAFFSPLIFSQYDIFTVLLVLLGLEAYFKHDDKKFVLYFGLAMTFKYFALLIFIPLLLLRHKKILKIIINLILFILPMGIETLLYCKSPDFWTGVFGFGAVNYFFETGINIPKLGTLSIVTVGFIVVCAWTYFVDTVSESMHCKTAIHICTIVAYLIFGLSLWHPQWIIFAIPFLVLGTVINKKADIFLLLDIILFVAFTLFTVNMWSNNVDQDMLYHAALIPFFIGKGEFRLPMQDILLIKDIALCFSVFSGILLVNAIFKHEKYAAEDQTKSIEHLWPIIRVRFLGGMAIFLVPAFISLAAGNYAPTSLDMRDVQPQGNIVLEAGVELIQPFYPSSDEVTRVGFRFGTYNRQNNCNVTVTVKDKEAVLFEQTISAESWVDNEVEILPCALSGLTPGKKYTIHLSSSNTTATDVVAVWHTAVQPNGLPASINGIQQDYQLVTLVG